MLLDAVCNHLNLVEGDYFGLEFPDHKKITVGDAKLMSLFCSLLHLGMGTSLEPLLGHSEVNRGIAPRKCSLSIALKNDTAVNT